MVVQVWMGDLEPYMDEEFVKTAFASMGETITGVKMMYDKFTGGPAQYCFIEFSTKEEADKALNNLGGKPVPGTEPPKNFRLNYAARDQAAEQARQKGDFTIFVGNLTPEVDDLAIHTFFAKTYSSIKMAKVVTDQSGLSRGFAFIRFSKEEDMISALDTLNGTQGLGGQEIKISRAVPKRNASGQQGVGGRGGRGGSRNGRGGRGGFGQRGGGRGRGRYRGHGGHNYHPYGGDSGSGSSGGWSQSGAYSYDGWGQGGSGYDYSGYGQGYDQYSQGYGQGYDQYSGGYTAGAQAYDQSAYGAYDYSGYATGYNGSQQEQQQY